MDNYDYIVSIIEFVRGRTSINFQLTVKYILKTYYDSIAKTFEMPDFYGGDDKNDGWVKEDCIFYQMYAPTRLKDSLKKEIHEKYKEDLTGLLEKIKEGKWNGHINEFIFIANTIDNNLPHDSDGYIDNISNALMKDYGYIFKYRLVNIDFLYDMLEKVSDVEMLKSLSARLRTLNYIDANAITEKMMIDLIGEISGKINEKFISSEKGDTYYLRISTPEKITLNNLEEKREEIEKILANLDVADEAIKNINQDILFEDKFDRVKEHIMDKYKTLSIAFKGTELYDKIIESVLEYVESKSAKIVAAKFLVVYIFDKCDIFEK